MCLFEGFKDNYCIAFNVAGELEMRLVMLCNSDISMSCKDCHATILKFISINQTISELILVNFAFEQCITATDDQCLLSFLAKCLAKLLLNFILKNSLQTFLELACINKFIINFQVNFSFPTS